MGKSGIPRLLLIRGVPGSGKSTLAKQCAGFVHLETDQFFSRSGVYRFEQEVLRDAHHWCLEETKHQLGEGNSVVVSNTFVTLKQLAPYLKLAADVSVYEATGEYRNTHGVPEPLVQKMRDRWEPYPDTQPLDTLKLDPEALAIAEPAPNTEAGDHGIMDLVISGHPEADILAYVESTGESDPLAAIVRATRRFMDQAERVPIVAQCGYLLDTFRELARKSIEIGDYAGGRSSLKEYFSVVRYIAESGIAQDPPDQTPEE